jgi:hypothetical protein
LTSSASPYDTDARRGGKRDLNWTGYKVHLSETCTDPFDEQAAGQRPPPNLVTNVATTDAATPDAAMTTPIHECLARRRLLPAAHLVDSGYPSGDLLVESTDRFGVELLTPLIADHSAQARAGAGFHAAAFTIDFDTEQATCPQGVTSTAWTTSQQRGKDTIVVKFPVRSCQPCPVRTQCTTARRGGRQLTIRPRQIHETVQRARVRQDSTGFQRSYRLRAGVEGTISQAVTMAGIRHARYHGLPKTHLQNAFTAIAINLTRIDAYLHDIPLDRTRTSHLTRLDLALAS